MQRFIKTVAVALGLTAFIFSIGVVVPSCGRKGWDEKQRKEAREMLRQWRDMVYLRSLTDMEFAIFANEVADILEEQYPSYVEFIEMPMVGDSVEVVVVAAIVADIKADATNMRHLFPYDELVKKEILPKGLTTKQQSDFYGCFAQRVNSIYGSVQTFVWDVVNSTIDDAITLRLLQGCAAPYWDIDVTIVEEWES